METIDRAPIPGSTLVEYFISADIEDNPLCCSTLVGISFPNPHYEIERQHYPAYTFEYIIAGKGTLTVDGQTVYPEAGDVYLLQPRNTVHYYSDPQDPWKKIWLNIYGTLIGDLLRLYQIDSYILFPNFQNGSYLERILQAAEEGGDTTGKILLILHEMMAALSEFINRKAQNPAYLIRDYINKNLDKQLKIEELCDLVHLSKSSIIRLFNQEFNATPYSYMMNRKVQLANTLLTKTTLPIRDVASQLGFSDAHNFSTFYKKVTGTSPGKFRRSQI